MNRAEFVGGIRMAADCQRGGGARAETRIGLVEEEAAAEVEAAGDLRTKSAEFGKRVLAQAEAWYDAATRSRIRYGSDCPVG